MRIVLALLLLAAAVPETHAQKPPPLAPGEAPGAKAGLPPLRSPQPAEGRVVQSGTGFMVGPGRLLTNNHVIQGCGHVNARNTAGIRVPAQLLATDPRRDLALLAVPPSLGPALTFRDGPPVRRGETVVTYGFPLSGVLSSGPTLTTGDISALAGVQDNPLHFQISAPIQPGNSGGPLFDAQGHVLGVIVAELNAAGIAQRTGGGLPQNVNFAIKGPEAVGFLASHNSPVQRAASTGADLKAASIGDIAYPSVMFLTCLR